jgi:hypothetical protein
MIYLIVLLAVLTRLLPHLPNFSPVYATLLFGGVHLRKRDAIWYPVVLIAASDIALTAGVYRMKIEWEQSVMWLGFATVALIGCWLRDHFTIPKVIVAAVGAPLAFFLISNFGVWAGAHVYPLTRHGLIACYLAALPFYPSSALSSLVYTFLLFGGYAFHAGRHGLLRGCTVAESNDRPGDDR